MPETGMLGSFYSVPGDCRLAGDTDDEVCVIWIGMRNNFTHPDVISFPLGESGPPVTILKGVPTIVSRAQANLAQRDGAILIMSQRIGF